MPAGRLPHQDGSSGLLREGSDQGLLAKTFRPSPLWTSRTFLLLFTGHTMSNVGDQIYILGLPWFLYQATHSALAVSLVTAVNLIPRVALGPLVGAMCDRWPKVAVMQISALVSAVITGILPVLYLWRGLGTISALALALALAIASLFYGTAFGASIPLLFGRERLAEVNGLLSLSGNGSRLIGPAMAGLLVAGLGPIRPLLFDSLSFVVLAFTLVGVRKITAEDSEVKRKVLGLRTEIAGGMQFLIKQRSLLQVVFLILLVNIGGASVLAILIFHIRSVLHFSAGVTGTVFAVGGAGSLLMGTVAGRIVNAVKRGTALLVSSAVFGVTLAGLAVSKDSLMFSALYFVLSAAGTLVNVIVFTIRHQLTPNDMLGRVVGTTNALSRLATPIAAVLGGTVSALYGSTLTILDSGLFVVVVAVVATMFTGIRNVA